MVRMTTRARPVGLADRDKRYAMWKEEHVPLLYDWVSSRRFAWPCAALCWGHVVTAKDSSNNATTNNLKHRNNNNLDDDGNNSNGNGNTYNYRPRSADAGKYSTRSLYMAERTNHKVDSGDPNTLLCVHVRIVEEHFSSLRDVAKLWSTDAVVSNKSNKAGDMNNPEFWLKKRIVHPCEVNAIRNFAPGKVVTLGDNPDLYMWDFNTQPNRDYAEHRTNSAKGGGVKYSKPDVTLKGHKEQSEFALAVSVKSPSTPHDTNAMCNGNGTENGNGNKNGDVSVASGGTHGEVLVWNLVDFESMGSTLTRSVHLVNHSRGHQGQVEAVGFNSADSRLLVSAARDKSLVLWDVRTPSVCSRVTGAHESDINSVDNFGCDTNLIATGGTDTKVKVWDKRKLTKPSGEPDPKHMFAGHTEQVNCVMWNRNLPGILASGARDSSVLVWDCGKDMGVPLHDPRNQLNGLLFNHAGHTNANNEIVALEWLPNTSDPWCIATLSETQGCGSDLQIWRMSNFIHRDKDEVNQDLVRYSANTNHP